jgi:hypothetical protein
MDHIVIFHDQFSWRLRVAQPVSGKEKAGSVHFMPLTQASVSFLCLHQFFKSVRLLHLEMHQAAILALDLKRNFRFGIASWLHTGKAVFNHFASLSYHITAIVRANVAKQCLARVSLLSDGVILLHMAVAIFHGFRKVCTQLLRRDHQGAFIPCTTCKKQPPSFSLVVHYPRELREVP